MKQRNVKVGLCLLLLSNNLIGQNCHAEREYFPFLDMESQSNVVVTGSDFFGDGVACPPQYSNALSNRNFFTEDEQKLISEVLVKYTNVTASVAPTGTVLVRSYTTNDTVKARGKLFSFEKTVSRFQYTNSEAVEEVTISVWLFASFRTNGNDGYDVSINPTGGGSLLQFTQVKHGLANGFLAAFDDLKPQGSTWDYKRADFTRGTLSQFTQYTNGLVFGKYFIWNPRNGHLAVEAEFKKPCDFAKHRTDLNMAQ